MVFEKIRSIIADQLEISEDQIEMETNLMKDLEADSLDAVEIIVEIENEFEIEIPEEDAENFQSVSDLVEYVEDLVK